MKNNNYTTSVIISLFLHALLLIALIWGADFAMTESKPAGNAIQAVVVDPALVHQQAQRIRDQRQAAQKAEQDRLKRLEQQADALEKQRKAEAERVRKLKEDKLAAEKATREAEAERKAKQEAAEKAEQLRQQKLAEQRKAEAAAKKADAERKVKEAAAAKAEAERKAKQEAAEKAEQLRQQKVAEQRKAEEAAKKAEADRKAKEAAKKKAEEAAKLAEQKRIEAEKQRKESERKAAEAKAKQQQQEAALDNIFDGLEAETQQRGGAKGQFIADETQRYGAIYKQMIQQNLLTDQSFIGKQCVLSMRLSANGLLLNVDQVSGDNTLCRAAKAAVVKISQFPMPEDPAVIEKLRNIKLTVSPQS
ncbi:TPA: cell envelope integrity protein TolA [Photobacterium damselae]|uniref:Cell envelope integrity protein TolA n=2 Tax=Photobacterium damselae TaxID=38293 RepID=A0ACD3T626_PHODM|nr:cell envelope integrity protein TolA [Photobacterium damselae]EHA1080359.1 cell envelope integrity protein TolA [Photobacterium damselae]EJN6958337.1 cell envelope integrity protein TolA [Photobacterium damselae]EJN6962224.1 cell envelope integrity protein TolA [Photobacterium damselae]ELI6447431.1 cell envelope integrity protein TolA [Photobacterium damselae]ELV7516039.1 cell envelope integrity protein TolA [Photobacterium damselae]